MENQMALYTSINIPECTNFESFMEKGFEITTGYPQVTTRIAEKEVIFDMEFPVTIRIEDQEASLSMFSTSIRSEIKKLHETALDLIVKQAAEPSLFAINLPVELGVEKNIQFEAFTFQNNDVVYSFIDPEVKIKNQPSIFTFAVKYSPVDIDILADFDLNITGGNNTET
ncbi:hypothetical protein ACFL6I_24130 [candidate division KSB1 bacterium]